MTPLNRDRFTIPLVTGLVFGVFALLDILAPASYRAILAWYGFQPYPKPFLDMDAIVAALQCAGQGVDVYQTNPCDMLGRPHVYSPLWLVPATFMPVTHGWTVPIGLTCDLLFILSLAWLPISNRGRDRWLLLIGCLSGMVAYGLERCNNDIVIFVLIIVGGRLCLLRGRSAWLGYGVIALTGLLKFYPLTGLIVLSRERPRPFFVLAGLIAAIILALAWTARVHLAAVAAHLPIAGAFDDTFGALNLPRGMAELIPPAGPGRDRTEWLTNTVLPSALLLLLVLQCAITIARHLRHGDLGRRCTALPPDTAIYLLLGSVLLTGCFFTGTSIIYRGCLFLMVLPGILSLRADSGMAPTGRALRHGLWCILFLMWSQTLHHPPIQLDDSGGRGHSAGQIFSAMIWLIRELAWWRVIALLMAVIFCMLATSPLVQRWRPA